MSNLLQSSQTQATTAPDFYTNYLSNLATAGQTAQQNAQFVGAQPLQQQAFQNVTGAASAFQPTLGQAGDVLTQAAGATNPLAAGSGYLQAATGSPAALAQQYMNPYINSAVQSMSDLGQMNIQQNIAPQATAAAVGSGQYGSQRGAQVLGQNEANAEQQLNSQIAQMLSTGYGQALQAGTAQNQLLGTLGATAGQQASAGQQNLTQAGGALNSLAQTNQALNLADINALSTLGGQQQTIAQNQQNYPLTTLASLAGLLQGQQIPSTVTTQLNTSPLSALTTIGAGAAGLFQGTGTNGTGPSLWQQITGSTPSQSFNSLGQLLGLTSSANPITSSGSGGADTSMSGNITGTTTDTGSIGTGTSYTGGTDGGTNSFGQNTTTADTMAP